MKVVGTVPPVPERAGHSIFQRWGGSRVRRVLLRQQSAGVIAAGAGEVGVDVHPPGHHDHASGIERGRAVRAGSLRPGHSRCRCLAPLHPPGWPGREPFHRRSEAAAPRSQRLRPPRRIIIRQRFEGLNGRALTAEGRPQRERNLVHPVRGPALVNAGDTGIDRHPCGELRPRVAPGPIATVSMLCEGGSSLRRQGWRAHDQRGTEAAPGPAGRGRDRPVCTWGYRGNDLPRTGSRSAR